jgi:MFS transporter, DHA1 family, staphyloferrin A biosynthesis exporter
LLFIFWKVRYIHDIENHYQNIKDSIWQSIMENALRFKNYKVFIGGSFFSLLGDYIGFTALNWVVWESTSSALNLGIINFVRLLPALFIGFLGGVLADKYSRKNILIILYIGMALLNFLLFYIGFSNSINIYLIATIVGIRGLFAEMEPSVRSALLPDLVSKESICSAVSLYTSTLNITAILGPAIAGYALARIGSEYLFLAQSFGQVIVLFSLFLLPSIKNLQLNTNRNDKSKGYAEVFQFLRQRPDLLCALFTGCFLMFFLFTYIGMMPAFVKNALNMGPETFGHFLMASALGTIVGSGMIGFLKNKINLLFIFISAIISCLFFVLLGLSENIIQVYFILFLIGFFSQAARTSNRVYFQIHSPSEIRGRLLSVSMSDRGFIPLGALLAGVFAQKWGVCFTFIIFGSSSFILLFALVAIYYVKERREVFQ